MCLNVAQTYIAKLRNRPHFRFKFLLRDWTCWSSKFERKWLNTQTWRHSKGSAGQPVGTLLEADIKHLEFRFARGLA